MITQWLQDKQGQVFRYKMEKFRYALELMGNPEKRLPVIHVAGTNGKGSTIAFLAAILQRQGLRIGSFVSPHLVSVEDRIRINQEPIASSTFSSLAQEIYEIEHEVKQRYEPFSYFETMTLMMFLYFSRQELDVALVETGIGGREDVTNVVHPLVSVITSIGLDHQDLLGETIEEIAAQKAGIIKPDSHVVLGPLPESAEQVCVRQAQLVGVSISLYGSTFGWQETGFRNEEWALSPVILGLEGRHQQENAAVAVEAAYQFAKRRGLLLDSRCIPDALAETRWAGRLEKIAEQPTIYLDGAHNVPAIERLITYIKEQGQERCTILFAALERKDYCQMVEVLRTELPHAALHVASLGGDLDYPDGVAFVSSYQDFLEKWQSTSPASEVLFVTGSLYFVSDVRAFLRIKRYEEHKRNLS